MVFVWYVFGYTKCTKSGSKSCAFCGLFLYPVSDILKLPRRVNTEKEKEKETMGMIVFKGDFKIKSKKDAEAFFKMEKNSVVNASDGEYYWSDGVKDYYLDVNGDSREVYERLVTERGNIFSPYWQVLDPVDVIWKTRKFINNKWFWKER